MKTVQAGLLILSIVGTLNMHSVNARWLSAGTANDVQPADANFNGAGDVMPLDNQDQGHTNQDGSQTAV